MEWIAVDAESLQGRKEAKPAGESIQLVPAYADGMNFVEIKEGIRQGGDASGVCDQNAEIQEASEKNRKDSEGVGSDVEFLEGFADSQNGRQGTEKVCGDIEGKEAMSNLGEDRREECGNCIGGRR